MSRVLPTLFNTEMVRAILDGRKTATRRLIMPHNRKKAKEQGYCQGNGLWVDPSTDNGDKEGHIKDYSISSCWMSYRWYIDKYAPYKPGDILYVRETWNYGYIETSESSGNYEAWFEPFRPDEEHGSYIEAISVYFYKADKDAPGSKNGMVWRPSIHMPKKAARIWLKVTDVRVERLRDISPAQLRREGMIINYLPEELKDQFDKLSAIFDVEAKRKEFFTKVWDSTIRKADHGHYGSDANPWVWVIEFERCEKPETSN